MRTRMMMALGCALPGVAAAQDVRPTAVDVPAHTEIVLRLNEEIGSERARVGQSVPVSVARDVVVDGQVVIPRGAAGQGVVTTRTGKGAFGKSGKLDIELRSVEIAGTTVPIAGRFHADGGGRAGATIATVLIGGVVAGAFVTGRHAVFEEGREFVAFTGPTTRVAVRATRMVRPPLPYAAVASAVPMSPVFAPAPSFTPVQLADDGTADPRYATLVRFQNRLAASQPVRGGDRKQGWTISD